MQQASLIIDSIFQGDNLETEIILISDAIWNHRNLA